MGNFPLGHFAGLGVVIPLSLILFVALLFVVISKAKVFTLGFGILHLHYERSEDVRHPGTVGKLSQNPEDTRPHTHETDE